MDFGLCSSPTGVSEPRGAVAPVKGVVEVDVSTPLFHGAPTIFFVYKLGDGARVSIGGLKDVASELGP